MLCGIRVWAALLGVTVDRWPSMWYGTPPLGVSRAQVCSTLSRHEDSHLAIVRYAPNHNALDEWVYNKPDIDAAKIVWAREMDAKSNRELIGYFQGRKVWLVEPDYDPPRISAYPAIKSEP
jgi:hypothetical protein